MLIIDFQIINAEFAVAHSAVGDDTDHPIFHVYTSRDLGPMNDPSLSSNEPLQTGIELTLQNMTLKKTLILPQADRLSSFSSLVIALFGTCEESGRKYRVPCGSDFLTLGALSKGSFPSRHVLTLSDPHPKSPVLQANVTIEICSIKGSFSVDPTDNCVGYCIKKQDELLNEKMTEYILRSMSIFFSPQEDFYYGIEKPRYSKAKKMVASHPGLKKIHCPFYQMDFIGRRLPGFAYSWILPRTAPYEEYFVNLIQKGLELLEVSVNDFLSAINEQDNLPSLSREYMVASDVVGAICSLYAQGQLYVPDHVHSFAKHARGSHVLDFTQQVENMSVLRVTHGNDCEDMGADNMITALTLKQYDSWRHPLTRACQKVLQNYLVLLPQAAVSSASISDLKSNQQTMENVEFIPHIFGLLIPYSRVNRMLQRTGTDPSLLGVPNNIPKWTQDLDVIFCEGTGRVSPILKPAWEWSRNDKQHVIQVARQQVQFEEMNRPFISYNIMQTVLISKPENSYDYSDFYRFLVASYVPIGQGATVGDITFVYSKKNAYGILARDLIYDENDCGIVVNEILSREETDCINNWLQLAHPVPQLKLRDTFLIQQDLHFLNKVLSLEPWYPSQNRKSFGYFFTMAELRANPNIVNIKGSYGRSYKYFGLDDFTAYIELCIYPR